MAGKTSFTPEEWARVVASPMIASMAITAADPSGLWGLLKEAMAGGWALLEAKQDAGANSLVKAVAEDVTLMETRTAARDRVQAQFKGVHLAELKSKAIDELRAVVAIVDAKAPEDAAGFKAWLGGVAQRAAEAGKEGGFLGFGGVAVSDAERATLAEISSVLRDEPRRRGARATPRSASDVLIPDQKRRSRSRTIRIPIGTIPCSAASRLKPSPAKRRYSSVLQCARGGTIDSISPGALQCKAKKVTPGPMVVTSRL